eukprot:gene759-402_t
MKRNFFFFGDSAASSPLVRGGFHMDRLHATVDCIVVLLFFSFFTVSLSSFLKTKINDKNNLFSVVALLSHAPQRADCCASGCLPAFLRHHDIIRMRNPVTPDAMNREEGGATPPHVIQAVPLQRNPEVDRLLQEADARHAARPQLAERHGTHPKGLVPAEEPVCRLPQQEQPVFSHARKKRKDG